MKYMKNNKRGVTHHNLTAFVMAIILTIASLGFSNANRVAAAGGTCPSIIANLEYATFPNNTVNVQQTAYGSYSHSGKNVTDIVPSGRVVAPFSGSIKYIDKSWGYVIMQSDNPVRYADGTVDYMCVGFMHDNNISDLYVGKHLVKGQAFYDKGDKKGAGGKDITGAHVHIIVMRGKFSNSMKSHYSERGNVYIYNAFWLTPNTKISKSSKYKEAYWRYMPPICPVNPYICTF